MNRSRSSRLRSGNTSWMYAPASQRWYASSVTSTTRVNGPSCEGPGQSLLWICFTRLASQWLDEQVTLVQRPWRTRHSHLEHQRLPLLSIVVPLGALARSAFLATCRLVLAHRHCQRWQVGQAPFWEASSFLVNRLKTILLLPFLRTLLLEAGGLASLNAGLRVGQLLECVSGGLEDAAPLLEDAAPLLVADRVVLVLDHGVHSLKSDLCQAGA